MVLAEKTPHGVKVTISECFSESSIHYIGFLSFYLNCTAPHVITGKKSDPNILTLIII